MRILVLGSTGYLGGHVTARLRTLPGARVLGGGRSPAAEFPVDLATVRPEQLAKALASAAPDTVVNCAGATGGDAVTLAEVNARGPAVLCAALREAAPGARLVHLGSAAEYGPGAPGTLATESEPTRPTAPYGATKLAGTVAVTGAGLDAVVLRVGNPVGPGAPASGLPGRITRLLRTTDRDGVLRLGDLSAYRDFVDVRDVARATVLAATAPAPLPPILNIGGGQAVLVRDLVHLLAAKAGFRGRIEENPQGPGGPAGAVAGPTGAPGPGGTDGARRPGDEAPGAGARGWAGPTGPAGSPGPTDRADQVGPAASSGSAELAGPADSGHPASPADSGHSPGLAGPAYSPGPAGHAGHAGGTGHARHAGHAGRVGQVGSAGAGGGVGGAGVGAGSVRSADVSWQCSDISAAEEALGWWPEYSLDDALTALWEGRR
jgi:NDP-hexose 4-ketoreductase